MKKTVTLVTILLPRTNSTIQYCNNLNKQLSGLVYSLSIQINYFMPHKLRSQPVFICNQSSALRQVQLYSCPFSSLATNSAPVGIFLPSYSLQTCHLQVWMIFLYAQHYKKKQHFSSLYHLALSIILKHLFLFFF